MKKTFILLFLALSVWVSAEDIPTGYYAAAQGLQGVALKDTLTRIIGDTASVRVSYGTWGYKYDPVTHKYSDERYEATWSYFPLSDRRQDGSVWDMYSLNNRFFPENLGSGCNLNIEHCFPNSWWGGEKGNKRAYNDLYHLNPADAKANQTGKSNYPLGEVDSIVKWENGFCKSGFMKGLPGIRVFEPADVYKGDFARAWFYIATCYADAQWQSTNGLQAMDTLSDLEFRPWLINILLKWHRQDPVSQKEIDRQELISGIQHNRNPYIDYPELVEYIWGNRQGQTVDFGQLTCTADGSYLPTEDYTNLRILPATEVTAGGFTAQWSEWDEPVWLEVYRRTQQEACDTLFGMSAVTGALIDKTPFISHNGQLNTSNAGNSATLMGKSSNDAAIYLNGQAYPAGAVLRMRVAKYYSAGSAELTVSVGNTLLKDTTWTSLDEYEMDITLPAVGATDTIVIRSVGGSTAKRANMLRIYVLQQTQQEQLQPLYSGWQPTGSVSYEVTGLTMDNTPVYYRITPAESSHHPAPLPSCEEEVVYLNPAGLSEPAAGDDCRKMIRNGRLYILRNGQVYDVEGKVLNGEW